MPASSTTAMAARTVPVPGVRRPSRARRGWAALFAAVLSVLLVAGPLGTAPANADESVYLCSEEPDGEGECLKIVLSFIPVSEENTSSWQDPEIDRDAELLLALDGRVLTAVSTPLGETVLRAVETTLVDVAALVNTADPRVAERLHADISLGIASIGDALHGPDGLVVAYGSRADVPAAAALATGLGAAQAGDIDRSLGAFGEASAALGR